MCRLPTTHEDYPQILKNNNKVNSQEDVTHWEKGSQMCRTAFRSRTGFRAKFFKMTDRIVFEKTKVSADAKK